MSIMNNLSKIFFRFFENVILKRFVTKALKDHFLIALNSEFTNTQ